MLYSYMFCFALVALSLYGGAEGQIVEATTIASYGTFKFLVKLDLLFAVKTAKVYFTYTSCGGTIIGWDWILTSAHCFFDMETEVQGRKVKAKWKRVMVTAGVKFVNGSNGQIQSIKRSDGRVWLHPEAAPPKKDVALIKLKESLNPSSTVATAWFLKTPMDYDFKKKIREEGGVDCILQGWGNTDIKYNPTLKMYEWTGIEQHAREGKFPLYQYSNGIFYITNGRGKFPKAAPGDSGSPVVCAPSKRVERDGHVTYERQDVHEHGMVYGVLSGGDCFGINTLDKNCKDPEYAVDVRVVNDWIEKTKSDHDEP